MAAMTVTAALWRGCVLAVSDYVMAALWLRPATGGRRPPHPASLKGDDAARSRQMEWETLVRRAANRNITADAFRAIYSAVPHPEGTTLHHPECGQAAAFRGFDLAPEWRTLT
jgi:hypothetical protein